MVHCLVWRTVQFLVARGAWKQDGACAYHVEKGLLPDQIGKMPALSHMPHYLSSSCVCLLLCKWYHPPFPASHTIVCLFLCVWYGDTMGTVYLFDFLTLCLLPLWFLLSTEKNRVAIQGCFEFRVNSLCLTRFSSTYDPDGLLAFSALSRENVAGHSCILYLVSLSFS